MDQISVLLDGSIDASKVPYVYIAASLSFTYQQNYIPW
jgi:hypothetical protein